MGEEANELRAVVAAEMHAVRVGVVTQEGLESSHEDAVDI